MARFVFMMLDGVGVGELPDAADYGDVGANTVGNVGRLLDIHLPTLERLGLGNILPLRTVPPAGCPLALVGRLQPRSAGKDTTVGHWEHMGLVTPQPFPTYPTGFPPEVIGSFAERIGRGVLGNKPASGTAIIQELGEEHIRTGQPIVYTSADSVFQIAAHVDVVPLEQLYAWCQTARELLTGPHAVARVIARPFTGRPGAFGRTKDRRDFSLTPPGPLYLDLLEQADIPVIAVGKISEIFAGRGISQKIKVASNTENLALLLELLRGCSEHASFTEGLLFTNLVDFDMVWGHRNDVDGFAEGLQAVDAALPDLMAALDPGDRLLITADHGVDPTTPSTDHSREYVPLLLYPQPAGVPAAVYEGGFADTGATIYSYLTGKEPPLAGRSLDDCRPQRGWRRYTATLSAPTEPEKRWGVRAGREEARIAATWLRRQCGPPPESAVVLGSGLTSALHTMLGPQLVSRYSCRYEQIPGWPQSTVAGHPGIFRVAGWRRREIVLLEGRLHGYEGFDLGEQQLATRTMAAWGVKRIIFTCAAGALAPSLEAGAVVMAEQILDFQYRTSGGAPSLLCGVALPGGAPALAQRGTYVAVPGPQYETEAERELLRQLGGTCVGMSLAAEVRAAQEEGLPYASLALVSNAGTASHEEVLAATSLYGGHLVTVLVALLAEEVPAG